MALGATIYKIELHVADLDRHYYGRHALTIARHPSETAERMMARLIAFSMHADEGLTFTKGLSEADEPDIWLKDLTGAVDLWVEVGQPNETRILRACGVAEQVVVYCYNGHVSKIWWDAVSKKLERAKNLKVICLPMEMIRSLSMHVERSMVIHVNIHENEMFMTTGDLTVNLSPLLWRETKH